MTPEYKDIEERHRHAMIKQSTTACAVSDLEKYHTALDKALLRYHGLKIGEINKIIRELWVRIPSNICSGPSFVRLLNLLLKDTYLQGTGYYQYSNRIWTR